MHKRDDGTKFVPIISITFCSSNIPIQIELKPKACAASCEYAAANVAS